MKKKKIGGGKFLIFAKYANGIHPRHAKPAPSKGGSFMGISSQVVTSCMYISIKGYDNIIFLQFLQGDVDIFLHTAPGIAYPADTDQVQRCWALVI